MNYIIEFAVGIAGGILIIGGYLGFCWCFWWATETLTGWERGKGFEFILIPFLIGVLVILLSILLNIFGQIITGLM